MENTRGTEDIPRTPRDRWEKYGSWATIVVFFPTPILTDALRGLGLSGWEIFGVLALVVGLGGYLLSRPARAARQRRRAADLELGVIDCAIRFPGARPGSLSDVWDYGAGQVEDGSLHFQSQLFDQEETPAGRKKTFPSAVLTEDVPDAPTTQRLSRAQRGWRTLHLETGGRIVQVAAPEEGCALLERAFALTGGSSGADGRS